MSIPKDSLIGLRHVSDALGSATHDYAQQTNSKMDLRTHPGKGWTAFELGLPRLQHHAADLGLSPDGIKYVERVAREQFAKAIPILESPIERTMFGALITGRWAAFESVPPRVHDSRRDAAELLPVGDVIIVPQMAFIKYRLDFGLVLERNEHRQIVAVECDGVEFHRNENAARDRIRNGYLGSWNIPTFRLKGSEIYEDAIRYADELIAELCHWKAS